MTSRGWFVIVCTALGLLFGAMLDYAIVGGIIGFVVGALLVFVGGASSGNSSDDAWDWSGDSSSGGGDD